MKLNRSPDKMFHVFKLFSDNKKVPCYLNLRQFKTITVHLCLNQIVCFRIAIVVVIIIKES